MSTFRVGDAVVHPLRGAGVVTAVEERELHGDSDEYYSIDMMGVPSMTLVVSTDAAAEVGLRSAIRKRKLGRLWSALKGEPEALPDDHKKRHVQLTDRLARGDTIEIAETVRDIAWRQKVEGRMTTVDKRLFSEGLKKLAGELAAVQGVEMAAAENEINSNLSEGMGEAGTS